MREIETAQAALQVQALEALNRPVRAWIESRPKLLLDLRQWMVRNPCLREVGDCFERMSQGLQCKGKQGAFLAGISEETGQIIRQGRLDAARQAEERFVELFTRANWLSRKRINAFLERKYPELYKAMTTPPAN